jgi:hypothetical protein
MITHLKLMKKSKIMGGTIKDGTLLEQLQVINIIPKQNFQSNYESQGHGYICIAWY